MKVLNMVEYFPLSYLLGSALFIWLFFDLIRGEVYLLQPYQRAHEPTMYWFGILLWGAVALSCFLYPSLQVT